MLVVRMIAMSWAVWLRARYRRLAFIGQPAKRVGVLTQASRSKAWSHEVPWRGHASVFRTSRDV